MFLLILLFIFILAISFFLSLYSMRDFQQKPSSKQDYGLFLVRNLNNLSMDFILQFLSGLSRFGFLVSFEKLFRGSQEALVLYGPKNILSKNTQGLNLLELEDYTAVEMENTSIFEVGVKGTSDLRQYLPQLFDNERIYFQIILNTKNKNLDLIPSQIRVIIFCQNQDRLKEITSQFHENFKESLPKIPKPFSKGQMFEFYKSRSYIKSEKMTLNLKAEDILNFSFFV